MENTDPSIQELPQEAAQEAPEAEGESASVEVAAPAPQEAPEAPETPVAAQPVQDTPPAPEATPAPAEAPKTAIPEPVATSNGAEAVVSVEVSAPDVLAENQRLNHKLDETLSELYQTRVQLHNALQAVEDEKETNRRLTAKVASYEHAKDALQAAWKALSE